MFIKKIVKFISNPKLIRQRLAGKGIIRMDDEQYVKNQFKEIMGYDLDFNNPVTFTEKINWLKINDRRPEYTVMADKYAVKEYIREKIGEEYIIPTLGIYNSFAEIDFSTLPSKFVIKCTHDCASVIIVEDKEKLDIKEIKKRVNKALKNKMFYYAREWAYKNIKPRIIIEQFMRDEVTEELRDYKFYCFNGRVETVMVATNRQSKEHGLNVDYFDCNYNHLPLRNHWHGNADIEPQRPMNFELMKELASKLSEGIPHVRVDLYEINNRVYFGELTLYGKGGFQKIHPDDWDRRWGDLLDLSIAYGRECKDS